MSRKEGEYFFLELLVFSFGMSRVVITCIDDVPVHPHALLAYFPKVRLFDLHPIRFSVCPVP
jgi:hypothetical protein